MAESGLGAVCRTRWRIQSAVGIMNRIEFKIRLRGAAKEFFDVDANLAIIGLALDDNGRDHGSILVLPEQLLFAILIHITHAEGFPPWRMIEGALKRCIAFLVDQPATHGLTALLNHQDIVKSPPR